MNWRGSLVLLAVLPLSALGAEFKDTLEAHGGLSHWHEFGAVEYDLIGWPSASGPLSDHEVVDRASQDILVTSAHYRLGFDGRHVWVMPSQAALGVPPRLYAVTPFRLFALPFLCGRSSAHVRPLAAATLGGRPFEAWDVTLSTSVDRAAPNHFVVYTTTDTHRLYLARFRTADPAARIGAASGDEEAVVFTQWQDIDDLLVPREANFYGWAQDNLGSFLGTVRYDGVRFHRDRPTPEIFAMPGGAALAN